jgi:phage terminase large subunit-like protein
MICSATQSKVSEYIQGVLNGEIVVGKLVRLAVERHVNDLERQQTESFPYYFDPVAAEVACDYFPMMLRHSIGEYRGLPFELQPWQAFARWVLFGWKRQADDTRRFRKYFRSVARKNGKSTEEAANALYLASFDVNPVTGRPEDVAEVILAATKKEQVERVIYAEIERMREQSSSIKEGSHRINKQIAFDANKGTIRCVGSERPYDGLNPSVVILDELHEWQEFHRKFYDTMLTGSGSRVQPLFGTVTTAGSERSQIWREEYEHAVRVLEGESTDEGLFAYIFQIDADDDPLDESCWIKANPNLGVSVKLQYLREQRKDTATDLNRFTRYHCNRMVRATTAAINMEHWDACKGELSDWLTADAIGGGVDLGGRDDLAAWGMVARFVDRIENEKPVYRYELDCQAYIADDTERDLAKPPFAEWVYEGLIERTPYPTMKIQSDIEANSSELPIEAWIYDKWNAQQLGETLESMGIKCATATQSCTWFNEPILEFCEALRDGRIRHNGNKLLRWCAGNAILKRDAADRQMFDKGSSEDKIDPLVAVVMAFRMACNAPSKASGSLYLM